MELLQNDQRLSASVKMINVSDNINEVSLYYELIKGTILFYSVPYDAEIALIKGQNAMHVKAEICQRCTNNLHESK